MGAASRLSPVQSSEQPGVHGFGRFGIRAMCKFVLAAGNGMVVGSALQYSRHELITAVNVYYHSAGI